MGSALARSVAHGAHMYWGGDGSEAEHPSSESGSDLGGQVAAVDTGQFLWAERQDDVIRPRVAQWDVQVSGVTASRRSTAEPAGTGTLASTMSRPPMRAIASTRSSCRVRP